jgi:3-phosphoshikimate 1-carboxyvinyltransferase
VSDFLVLPRAARVEGAVRVPPSKSATNRALLLAALSAEPVEIVQPLESGDTAALAACLAAMGARVTKGPGSLRLRGPVAGSEASQTALDAADSGTAARFLAALCAATPGRFLLDGSPRLRERPMEQLIAALRSAGAEISCPGAEGRLPLAIRGGALRSGTVTVDASRSSQFVSALLLAAVAVPGGLTVRVSGALVSAPYVDETIAALSAFGHTVSRSAGGISAERGPGRPDRYEVPGDASSAVPLLAAAGAAGGRVDVLGVSRASTAADARALAVLERMGIGLEDGPDRVTASAERGALRPVAVVATDFPDSVPALAALAILAPGESALTGIGHLRGKESDRIAALGSLAAAAGAPARADADALFVSGGPARPGAAAFLPTFRDHRIAMAAGLIAIARGGFLIENPGCVAKSYPSFFRDLAALERREPLATIRR